jgi:hypothetical protein
MEKQEIIEIQKKIGTEPDGFWGPKSIAALKKYLRNLAPKKSPWPNSDQASLRKFYGTPGDESNLTNINVSHLPISYDGKKVNTIRCHKKVADSLSRILNNIFSKFKNKENILEEAKDYGGCFNFRLKRGGNTYSVHSWGAAIDLDADDNTFKDSWPMKADMPLEIIEEFTKEGWTSAAAFWGYDAMHFESTKIPQE